jgi:hypothetical protein
MELGKFRNRRSQIDVGRSMSWSKVGGVVLALAVLLFGTVLVFQAFDRNSNSASDTIRPFVITMGPVWVLTIWAVTVVLRKPRP